MQAISNTEWRVATVTHVMPEAPGIRTFTFTFDTPVKHDAGQHYEIRLTAADGYQAARLYSAAMPANGTSNALELTIARMPDGEVSSYLFDNVKVDSQLEIRGPLGRYFIWTPEQDDPILLVGGGTGIIPLRCMRLEHQQASSAALMKLLYSVRTYEDMVYKYELLPRGGVPSDDVILTFTQDPPADWSGYTRRVDAAMISDVLADFPSPPRAYVCGTTPLVENVTRLLVDAGIDPAKISAERFGATA